MGTPFNEDNLLGNNLQAINNAEAAFQEEHRFEIFNVDAPVERASMANDSLFGPRVAAQQRRTYQSKFTRTPRPWARRLLLCFGFQCPNR